MSLNYSQKYLEDVLVRFAYHSTGIEGNSMTLGETRSVLLDEVIKTAAQRSLREIYEVDNHKAAFHRLLIEADKQTPINESLILDFHKDLTQNVVYNAGHFKESTNYIGGADFQTASPEQVPFLIRQWCDNLNYQLENSKNEREYLQALLSSHVQFEQYHPFSDGNGRTGRLLINFELAKKNMPFLVIAREDRPEYVNFLADNDIDKFVDYAENKLKEEKKRRDSFNLEAQKQAEFEKQQFEMLKKKKKER